MKNKIINFLFKKRIKILRNKKGFSMMEILVAVAIVGILGAITVPRYQQYMKDTQTTAKDNSLRNIAKAFAACTALKGLDACDTLAKIGVTSVSVKANTSPDVSKSTSGIDRLCVGIENVIGGVDVKSCVEANVQGDVSFTSNQGFCYKQGATPVPTITAGDSCCGGSPGGTPCTHTCDNASNWDGDCASKCGDSKVDGTFCSTGTDCDSGHCHSGNTGSCTTGDCG